MRIPEVEHGRQQIVMERLGVQVYRVLILDLWVEVPVEAVGVGRSVPLRPVLGRALEVVVLVVASRLLKKGNNGDLRSPRTIACFSNSPERQI